MEKNIEKLLEQRTILVKALCGMSSTWELYSKLEKQIDIIDEKLNPFFENNFWEIYEFGDKNAI